MKPNPSHRKQYLKHATLTFYSPNVHWPECCINTCNSFEQFSVETLLISLSRVLSSWQKRNTAYTLKPLGNWKWALSCSWRWSKQFSSPLGPHINAFDNCWTEFPSSVTAEPLSCWPKISSKFLSTGQVEGSQYWHVWGHHLFVWNEKQVLT